MIGIVTGELHSGKTTLVKQIIANGTFGQTQGRNFAGFLCEAVFQDSTRIGYDLVFLPDGTREPFMRLQDGVEVEGLQGEIAGVDRAAIYCSMGKYDFFGPAFQKGEQLIDDLLGQENPASGVAAVPPVIVMDEIGFLELQGRGFAPLLRRVLDSRRDVLLAVRRQSLSGLVQTFSIPDYDPEWISLEVNE